MSILPNWTVKTSGEIAPDERLPWPQTIAIGIQHVVAMFGSTALAPILMGFDPNTPIFFSGHGTLSLFGRVIWGRVSPSSLWSSPRPAFQAAGQTRIFPWRWAASSPVASSMR